MSQVSPAMPLPSSLIAWYPSCRVAMHSLAGTRHGGGCCCQEGEGGRASWGAQERDLRPSRSGSGGAWQLGARAGPCTREPAPLNQFLGSGAQGLTTSSVLLASSFLTFFLLPGTIPALLVACGEEQHAPILQAAQAGLDHRAARCRLYRPQLRRTRAEQGEHA